jgi:hypothetical protein
MKMDTWLQGNGYRAASKLIMGSIKIDNGQYENGDWVAYSAGAEGEKVDRVE